jgi:hypothetical protein
MGDVDPVCDLVGINAGKVYRFLFCMRSASKVGTLCLRVCPCVCVCVRAYVCADTVGDTVRVECALDIQ